MPVSIPTSEQTVHSIDATLAANSARISRGLFISTNPGTSTTNNFTNTLAANGLFGVLVEDQLPNTLSTTKKVQLPCCTVGLTEILVGATAVVRGAPLTADTNNAAVTATAGQKVYARALAGASANTFVLARVHAEGTL